MQKHISNYKDGKILYNHAIHTSPADISFDFHIHDICELIFLKSGNVSGIIGDKIYKLKKNSLIIFRANVPHRIIIEGDTQYERYDILFDENALANKIFHRLPKDLNFINCSGNSYIIDLFKKLDFYYQNFNKNDFGILVRNVVEELLFNIYLSPTDDFNNDLISMHPIISKAIEYVNEHYAEQITIDTLCDYLCITKSHLHHLFMEAMQITPKKYINMRRLAKAQKLIRMGEKPSYIYPSCGFSDYATFFRNYTTHFGYTPSQENEIITGRKIES